MNVGLDKFGLIFGDYAKCFGRYIYVYVAFFSINFDELNNVE